MGVGVRMMAMGAAWPWRRRRGNHFFGRGCAGPVQTISRINFQTDCHRFLEVLASRCFGAAGDHA